MNATAVPVLLRRPFIPAPYPARSRSYRRKGLGSLAATNPSPYSSATNAALYSIGTGSGIYQALSSKAPVTAKVGSSLVAAAPFTGPAAPFVAAAGALTSLFGQVFGGCGQACVQSATAEQVYESAADNISKAAKAGYISGTQASSAISQILAAGQQNLSQLATANPKAQGGLTNLTNTIQGNLQAVSAIGNATKSFDPGAVSSLFVPTNASGWESGATAAGAGVAAQALNNLGLTAGQSASATNFSSEISSLTSSPLLLLAIVGGGIYLLMRR